jgi:hypothetical protein
MIPKSGNRFSDQIMRMEKMLGAFATVSRRVGG